MKQGFSIVLAGMLSTQLASSVLAQEWVPQEVGSSGSEALLPPRVDHVAVRATLLQGGMSRDDVNSIMGRPGHVDSFSGEGGDVHVLKYPAEPIVTTVTVTKTLDSCLILDVNQLSEKGCLRAGCSTTCQWTVGNEVASVNLRAEAERLHLFYTVRVEDGKWPWGTPPTGPSMDRSVRLSKWPSRRPCVQSPSR
jgi:hypothetical protein